MISWSFLFMLVNAMRIVAPAFVFGLTFSILSPKENQNYRTECYWGYSQNKA
jgi:hypothetical protein